MTEYRRGAPTSSAGARVMASPLVELLAGLAAVVARADELTRRNAEARRRAWRRPPKRDRPRCGARRRDGSTCKAPVAWPHGSRTPGKRCRQHGGAGKARQAALGARWRVEGDGRPFGSPPAPGAS